MCNRNISRVLDILKTFIRFGFFTFGGGWSIVAQIQKVYVEDKHWITDEELLDFTSTARSVPGLMIGNVSVLFGYHTAGVLGAISALIGIVIPPFLIMIGVTTLYDLIQGNPYAARLMMGVRAAVAPIILNALLKLFKSGIKGLFGYLVAIGAFALCLFTNINNVLIVLMGAVAGLIYAEGRSRHAVS